MCQSMLDIFTKTKKGRDKDSKKAASSAKDDEDEEFNQETKDLVSILWAKVCLAEITLFESLLKFKLQRHVKGKSVLQQNRE